MAAESRPHDHLSVALGMEVVSASADQVVVQWTVDSRHHQPMGIVHGGVYCAAVETACSVGATLSANGRDPNNVAVGLENTTSFIRAVREGTLRCTATPLTRGRRTQVWQAEIRNEQQELVARGQLRALVVRADDAIG